MPKTDRPSLENLRKRAKTLVRQHRDGYHPVAAKLRACVPRFAALTDQAILDAAFTLTEPATGSPTGPNSEISIVHGAE